MHHLNELLLKNPSIKNESDLDWKHDNVNSLYSLYDVFQFSLKNNPESPFLGKRRNGCGPYVWMNYKSAANTAELVGSFILKYSKDKKLLPDVEIIKNHGILNKIRVGICSINRPEWILTDIAINLYSMINVALYDTLGPNTVSYILKHAELPIVVCSLDKISSFLKSNSKHLKLIISMDSLATKEGNVLKNWASSIGIDLLEWAEVLQAAKGDEVFRHIPPTSESVSSICYTSGTTSDPKGAILTHANFASIIANFYKAEADEIGQETHISYLPLAHCYERAITTVLTLNGSAIGFYSGDVLKLLDDIQELKPTLFISVPRLYNRIYARLVASTIEAPGFKGIISRRAVADKIANMKSGKGLQHKFWDALIFNRVRNVLGGRVKLMVTGSAPIDSQVLDFLRIAFCCEILEGYGTTESTAFGTLTERGDYEHSGTVGRPRYLSQLKLIDVPEMGYFTKSAPPRGEICLKGPFVFKGYFKDDEKTKEALLPDNWLATGDIGEVTSDGNLRIIDRKKNLFKLAQGEYIAPEKLENVYTKSKYVSQIFVTGDSLKSSLVAIVVPDFEYLAAAFPQSTNEALCKDVELKKLLLIDFKRLASEDNLRGFEYICNIFIDSIPFSVQNDIITPTFKIKRHVARKCYEKQIKELYEEIEKAPNSKL